MDKGLHSPEASIQAERKMEWTYILKAESCQIHGVCISQAESSLCFLSMFHVSNWRKRKKKANLLERSRILGWYIVCCCSAQILFAHSCQCLSTQSDLISATCPKILNAFYKFGCWVVPGSLSTTYLPTFIYYVRKYIPRFCCKT